MNIPNRTPEECQLIDTLYRLKREYKPYSAYCTTVEPLTLLKFTGKWINKEPEQIPTDIQLGTTLKIVMVSRFEDFRLTDNLDAANGYHLRLPWDTTKVANIRDKP